MSHTIFIDETSFGIGIGKWLPLTFDIEKFEAFLLDTQKKDWQKREQSNISKQSLKRSEPNNMASSTKR